MARPRLDEAIQRADILEVSGGLFHERGFERTTLKAIGEQLGVSGQAILYHFASKGEVLFRLLEMGLKDVLARTSEAVASAPPGERLRQLVRTHLLFELGELPGSRIYAPVAFGYFQLIKSLEPSQRRRLDRLQSSYLDLVRSCILEAPGWKELEPIQVTAAAFAITGMASHPLRWFRPDGKLTATDIADLYAEFAVRMLQPDKSARHGPLPRASRLRRRPTPPARR